jgi:hypothetical protein
MDHWRNLLRRFRKGSKGGVMFDRSISEAEQASLFLKNAIKHFIKKETSSEKT